MTATVRDRLLSVLDAALQYDGNVVEPPVALLWPDTARQWEQIVDALREVRRIVRLGDHDLARAQGPAYWVRCVVVGAIKLGGDPDGVPIIYMPGVSRDDVRTLASTTLDLAPLAAIQHRSHWFTHPNGKDWTVRALFGQKDRGLGLSVAGDDGTASALIGSLPQLLGQPLSRLEGRYLDATFLNGLLNPDLVRLLLQWFDDPKTTEHLLGDAAWKAFVQQCRTEYDFDPPRHGVIEGAQRLGSAEGPWAQVWQRFRESPADYPEIPSRLREAQPALLLLPNQGAWPTPAADAENALRAQLIGVAGATSGDARAAVLALEEEHKARRGYVWADLGWTPLTLALEHLGEIARRTASATPTSSVSAIADWYAEGGWQVDRAVLSALEEVTRIADIDAVAAALNAIYQPWLDNAATALQLAVGTEANVGTYQATPPPSPTGGEVVVFIDGLRLDVAHVLTTRLHGAGCEVHLSTGLAALPTVTQTAKPALVPVDQSSLGPGSGLSARRAPDGPTAGVHVLRALLTSANFQVIGPIEVGDPSGRGWTETGEIDRRGHELGVRLANEIDDQVQRIAHRIQELLQAGWSKVTVVTDHGWLLLPGGLPKNDGLPMAATVAKKGRCARLKDGAIVDVPTVPWHWDNDVRIALAPGISCFEANQTYEHGGVSPQECIVPRLTITSNGAAVHANAEITRIKWRGLTLVVEFSELPDGVTVDLRRHAGDAGSSIADLARVTGGTGKVILLVEDEDLEGDLVYLVVAASDGTILLRRDTVVGQNL